MRTKAKFGVRFLAISLALTMALSAVPMTAFAAPGIPDRDYVIINTKRFNRETTGGGLYYTNGAERTGSLYQNPNWNAHYDPTTGVLTLRNYEGRYVGCNDPANNNLTIKLEGHNTITERVNYAGLFNVYGGTTTITADEPASLTINVKGDVAYGIYAGSGPGVYRGSVVLKGKAHLITNATATSPEKQMPAVGVFVNENFSILDQASFTAVCKSASSSEGNHGRASGAGICARKEFMIDTDGTVYVDTTGCAQYNYAIYGEKLPGPSGEIKKVDLMTLKWKSDGSNGGPLFRPSLVTTAADSHVINVDAENRAATYRRGTPYTVTVASGSCDAGSGQYAAGETVNITADASASGEYVAEADIILNDPVHCRYNIDVGFPPYSVWDSWKILHLDSGGADVDKNVKAGDISLHHVTLSDFAITTGGSLALNGSISDASGVLDGSPTIGSSVEFKLKGNAASGSTAEIPLTFTPTDPNYRTKDLTLTIHVKAKDSPVVTVNPITVTYTGNPVPESEITGSASFGGNAVAGSFVWKSGQYLTNVFNRGFKTAIFKPADSSAYEDVEARVKLTINRADCTGEPTYQKITESDKILFDAKLEQGTLSPVNGQLGWTQPFDTPVQQGQSYDWYYKPPYIHRYNYNTLTGSIVLWENGPVKTDVNVSISGYTPTDVYEATPLSAITLIGTKVPDVEGTLALDAGQTLTAGTADYAWTFTPDDGAHYNTARGTVAIKVLTDSLQNLRVSGTPSKTDYVWGDSFQTNGITVTAHYASGQTADVTTQLMADPLEPGDTSVILRYQGMTCTVGGITVRKADVSVSISGYAPTDVYESTPLSAITLSAAKTPNIPGTLALDAGQTFTSGTVDYAWTFTPNDGAHYNAAHGTIAIAVAADALREPKGGVFPANGKAILHFPNGHVWEFRENTVHTANGKSYTQMQALSLTELYAKKSELEQKNRELENVNKRAKQLYETLDKTVREEEAFAIKMRVHNDIGLRLLSTHKVLREGGLDEIREAGKMWQSTLHVLHVVDAGSYEETDVEQEVRDEPGGMLRELLASASGIGVNIQIEGALPKDKEQRYLLMTAIMECATNTVRHARGSEMTVRLSQINNRLSVWIENNGIQPQKNIVEGGGLSDLRRRIEKAGGRMTIQSSPEYRLTITLPRKER